MTGFVRYGSNTTLSKPSLSVRLVLLDDEADHWPDVLERLMVIVNLQKEEGDGNRLIRSANRKTNARKCVAQALRVI